MTEERQICKLKTDHPAPSMVKHTDYPNGAAHCKKYADKYILLENIFSRECNSKGQKARSILDSRASLAYLAQLFRLKSEKKSDQKDQIKRS